MNTSLFIAFRYWRSKRGDRFGRLVSNLAALGIVLGVMALIIVLSVMNGLETMQKQNLLTSLPHAIVSPIEENLQKNAPIQALAAVPSVVKSVPINRANVVIQSQEGINAGVLIGIENRTDDPLVNSVIDIPHLLPQGEFNLLISTRLAQKLRLNIGDKIRLMITENSQYTPFGRIPVQRLFTIADIYYSTNEAADYTLFANLTDVGKLLRLNEEEVQGQRLFLNDPFSVTQLAQYFPADQWQISDWREQKGEFFQAVRMEKNMMGLLVSLIIIVAVSNILTSLSLMVVDKQGEIAILQTQGFTKRQIMHVFIIQGAFVGILGAILGAILGVIISPNLSEILHFFGLTLFLPNEISSIQIAIIIIGSVLLSLICTLYPAYQAAKIEPAQALRYE